MADQSSFLVPLLLEMTFGVDAWKKPVKVVATSNITLTGLQTIDGVLLAAGDEVLATAQGNAAQNGIWTAATGAWARRFDATTSERLFEGVRVPVTRGTENAGSVYRLATTGKINVGITAQIWELDSQGGGASGEVDPDPNTVAQRGSAGELKAVRVELASRRLLPATPTQLGDIGFRSNGRPMGWNPATGAAEDFVLRSDVLRDAGYSHPGDGDPSDETTAILTELLHAPHVVDRAMVLPLDDLVADDTDFATIRVVTYPGLTVVAQITTETDGSSDWSGLLSGSMSTFLLSLTGATVPTGACLILQILKSGLGVAVPRFSLFLKYRVDPDYTA
ncbi:hypothetical protein WMF30_10450 [Sorangium sp. So ce134]